MEVLIVGAGTTGLPLAQGLKHHGIKTTVFEAESPSRLQREWGMSLHWGTEAINKLLPPELQTRIREIWCDPHYNPPGAGHELPNYAGHSGALLFTTPMKDGMRVSRRKMRKSFSEGIDVKYDKRLVSISKTENDLVIATFADGTIATGSLIVGSDGAKSMTRMLLVGPQLARNEYVEASVINFVCNFDATTANLIRSHHPVAFISYHQSGWMFWVSVQDIPDPEEPASWRFQLMFSWIGAPSRAELETQEARTVFLKSKASSYAEPWQTVLGAITDNVEFKIDRLSKWVPIDWSEMPLADCITLVGDAAHAMSPFRGQGLNNGLEDAALLTDLLSKADPTAAGWTATIHEYESEMRPRASREIQVSDAATKFAHDFEQLMNSPLAKFGTRRSKEGDL